VIAVIFELWPATGRAHEYFDLAAELRPLLDTIDGFVSVERFVSRSDPDKLLSLSVFRDETAVQAWRTIAEHRVAQVRGRSGIFRDYRLRVAEVVRDYGLHERVQAPSDSRARHRDAS
jgi:heme-degrading monooxygenase HmoA